MRLRSNMKIVEANLGHVCDIANLERLCFSAPWNEKAITETMQGESIFLVAEENGKTCGYIGSYYCHPEGYITNVAVMPEMRRRGIGRELIKELIVRGRELSLSFWTLEVRESNKGAIALYSSLGFQKVGRRPRFYRDPEEAAELMTYYMDTQKA